MRVHVEVDTGMGRQGVRPGAELEELLDAAAGAGLVVDGVFTHFCESEVAGSEVTRVQQRRFEAAVGQVRARGLRPAWIHAGNSSFIDNPVGEGSWLVELAKSVGARAMVRSGLALYGYCLAIEGDAGKVRRCAAAGDDMEDAGAGGAGVGDGRDGGVWGDVCCIGGDARGAATGGVCGWAAAGAFGIERAMQGGWVMVRGRDGVERRAAIVGRVSMNLTVVDVTGVEGVVAGDEVVLLGDGVTAEDHARLAGTIPYEIFCGVRER